MKSKILGICGGNGVILHPFKDNLLGNIEPRAIFHTPNDKQWKLNFKVNIAKDQRTTYAGPIDIIIGAPDCGHSSKMSYSRAKVLTDPAKNDSLMFFVSQVLKYKPKAFMMENLPKALEALDGSFEEWMEDYRLHLIIGSVSEFGNSQITRHRLVIVGVRKDLPETKETIISAFPMKPLMNEANLLHGLEERNEGLCHVREPDDYTIPLYYKGARKMTVARAREIWNTKLKRHKRWPVQLNNMVNQPGVYKNLANEYPMTVRKQNRQFKHDGNMLSPREMARIQGVPDSFKLWFDPFMELYCINKARATVAKSPPYEIGSWFYNVVLKLEKIWAK